MLRLSLDVGNTFYYCGTKKPLGELQKYHLDEEIGETRSKIADRLLITLSIIALPAVGASLFRALSIGWQPVMWLHVVAILIIWAVTLLRKRLSYRLRSATIISLTFSIGIGGFLNFALSGAGQAFILISIVCAAVLFNTRASILVMFAGCMAVISIGYAYSNGIISTLIDLNNYSQEYQSWLNVLFSTALLGAGAVTSIVSMNKALSRAANAHRAYNKDLENEVDKRTRDLEESRQRFQDFAAASTDRFWETDERHLMTFISSSDDTQMGTTDCGLLGKTRWEIAGIDPNKDEKWRNHIADLDARKPFRELVVKITAKDGRIMYFSASGKPCFDWTGKFIGYRGTSTDVTERENLDRLKKEFISTISHELRTPLTSIRGALGLLSGGAIQQLTDEAKSLASIAERNSVRLNLLVNDLLDFEKLESGKMEYNFEADDLVAAAKRALDANQHFGEAFDVTFTLSAAPTDAPVRADPNRLDQVFANLLSNAAKFSPKGAEVDVKVVDQGDAWRLSVRDHGPGIPEQFRSRIFERFTQAESGDSRSKSGTGLGLSITRAIVLGHGGKIDFDTEPGAGTTFFCDFPKHLNAASPS